MQSIYNQKLFLFRQLHRFSLLVGHLLVSWSVGFTQSFIKPFLEIFAGWEDLGQQEIKQGPELTQIVLERRACQK